MVFSPVFLELLETLKGIQCGKIEDKDGWCMEVTEPKLTAAAAQHEPSVTEINAL